LRNSCVCGAVLMLALIACPAGALVIIDDFQNPVISPPSPVKIWLEQYIVGVGDTYANPGFNAGLPLASTIGGRRDFALQYIGGGSIGAESQLSIIGFPDQNLQFSNDAGVMATFWIGYGMAVPLDWDTTAPATFSDTIELVIRSTDHDSQFIAHLASGVGTLGEVHEVVIYSLPSGFTGPFVIPLSDFPNIDVTDIDQIGFIFGFETAVLPGDDELQPTYVADLQLSVDVIRATGAIPEPTTLALLGLGALALARKRRRA